jgi:predicted lipid-binding transport protein (Tim44 family)
MKVRCKGCGKVVRAVIGGASSTCPECGSWLAGPTQSLSTPPASTSQLADTTKGELPTEDKAARNAGCLIMGGLLFGVPMLIAAITEGDNAAYWVLAIGVLIALIPLGVWFERNTIRRK